MSRNEQPRLQAVGLTKRFPGVTALDSVSIDFHGGEVHAVVGENGAGKSTLIKLINGVYQADEGALILDGTPVDFDGPREAWESGISTTFQEINLQPFLSVAQNLHLGREPTRRFLLDKRKMNTDATDLLTRYGISIDVRRPLGSVGVAVQQMIAIVRAVSTDARVVILDEPTSSLEPSEIEQLFRVIRILRDDEVALLYVSHTMDEIFEICDRVSVLRDGSLVHTGPVADITRLQLVATMLGREAKEVRTSGKTAFSIEGRSPGSEPVLSASGLTRSRMLNGVSIDVSAGEVVGLAGLLGSGRTETVESIFGLIELDAGKVEMNGSPMKTGSPTASVDKGIGLLPEDRKADGIIPTMSVKDNITLAAWPAILDSAIQDPSPRDPPLQHRTRPFSEQW